MLHRCGERDLLCTNHHVACQRLSEHTSKPGCRVQRRYAADSPLLESPAIVRSSSATGCAVVPDVARTRASTDVLPSAAGGAGGRERGSPHSDFTRAPVVW